MNWCFQTEREPGMNGRRIYSSCGTERSTLRDPRREMRMPSGIGVVACL
ncbi:MAG TPA: hypothetical protein VF420_09965 [Casimicrobiaceae bacterium]